MNDLSDQVNGITQLSLLPPGHTTLVLKIDVDPRDNSASYSIELTDADSDVTLGIWVLPLRKSSAWQYDTQTVVDRICTTLAALIEPF